MENPNNSQHSLMPTLVAFMASMALAWALTFTFFFRLDAYRKSQVKGIRGQVRELTTNTEQIKTAMGIPEEITAEASP